MNNYAKGEIMSVVVVVRLDTWVGAVLIIKKASKTITTLNF